METNLRESVLSSMKAAFLNFVQRRKLLLETYAIPATEKVIAQHFLFLADSSDAPTTLNNDEPCEWCSENEFFEPFPPKHFREWMTQLILHQIDCNHLTTNLLKQLEAENTAKLLFHLWLNRLHARERKEEVSEHSCGDYDGDCNCGSALCQCCVLCCLEYVR